MFLSEIVGLTTLKRGFVHASSYISCCPLFWNSLNKVTNKDSCLPQLLTATFFAFFLGLRVLIITQVGAFRPMLSDVQDTVHSMESNPWNKSSAALQKLGPNLQDGDDTRELTNQDDWLGDASSDMSTTPLSPRRPNFLQGLTNNPQGSAMQTGSDFMDSPSLQDGITASIPKVKDLLAADEGASESESAWNPRRISWSTQHQSHQTVVSISEPC